MYIKPVAHLRHIARASETHAATATAAERCLNKN